MQEYKLEFRGRIAIPALAIVLGFLGFLGYRVYVIRTSLGAEEPVRINIQIRGELASRTVGLSDDQRIS